ncbi:DNA mismatch repair protein [Rasamsonia emersonii CBS 393.64]|uniref:DNA mismatch repair protein n=1 Tax=Rasamsonia emersonii (strain ATCC 16479 / CBS 393.64 / IMI 116815) TaxID=1408163 RepID=A0A0F4YFI7_RASE3|nr:DNA mismatch repair protein [Rasamsonia emersonii CBS 393.64]KKA16378.1 DNA mismatch repair protein [Rasamsonia emersonii CBS 393.64]
MSSAYTIGTSYPLEDETTTSVRIADHASERPWTARPTTTATSIASQEVICAVSESRGVSPTVGLAFVNLSTSEAVLCQICDSQSYVKTINKIGVFEPSELIFMNTATQSKLYCIVQENFPALTITCIDRRYWSDRAAHDYVEMLAFPEEIESIRVSMEGHYFAACCLAAVLKYVELQLCKSFAFHSLRIKFEPSQGSMMIDLSTIVSLELIQNLQKSKSRDCLFGLLNETLTPMGSRLLRSNILQPSTEPEKIVARYDALEELSSKEEMFYSWRLMSGLCQLSKGLSIRTRFLLLSVALHSSKCIASVLTRKLILNPVKSTFHHVEQSVNHVIMLKSYVMSINPVYEALAGAQSALLKKIRDAGVNSLLDVARQTYKEANADATELVTRLAEVYDLSLDLKFDSARQYYISLSVFGLDEGPLPDIFINCYRKRDRIECQTLDLVKLNQRITDAHNEVINMSDRSIQELISEICADISGLFRISEAIATLDMLAAFAQLVTTQEYVRPELTDVLAIKSGRHPIQEKIHRGKFVPNDTYAAQQSRFQIITGCNMSGKSTYIRSIALMTIMAHIGCFVPADYASFPIVRQLFARAAAVDEIHANVSTFAAEMREMSFILRNIDPQSMVVVDELCCGTSTTDGLAISIAIAEAFVDSHALVWFATHFRDLARIMAERSGVVNLHLAVQLSPQADKMTMLYKVQEGHVQEKFYGLALAKVLSFPQEVLETAQMVSTRLNEIAERHAAGSKTLSIARRRRLILHLRERLLQAVNGTMEGETLRRWLERLQEEFALKMAAIDAESDAFTGDACDNGTVKTDDGQDSFQAVEDLEYDNKEIASTG